MITESSYVKEDSRMVCGTTQKRRVSTSNREECSLYTDSQINEQDTSVILIEDVNRIHQNNEGDTKSEVKNPSVILNEYTHICHNEVKGQDNGQ